jgi:hypothetical protein
MSDFDDLGIDDPPLTEDTLQAWLERDDEREREENRYRAMANAGTSLSQQLGLRHAPAPEDGDSRDNLNELDPIVDPMVREFLDIAKTPAH